MSDVHGDHSHGDHSHGDHGDTSLGVHGMALVGEQTLYLSHLPMFMAPHDFQVILEVTLDKVATERLHTSRASGARGLYTFQPEAFRLTELIAPGAGGSPRTRIKGDLFSGHFEKGGTAIARATTATVVGIAYFSQLSFDARDPDLSYILFGKGEELFLAHHITAAPDFDQLLSVAVEGVPEKDILKYVREQVFADADRFDGLCVTFEGRENSVHGRLKAGEKSAARGHVTGRHSFLDLQVEGQAELYFEEGELADPPTFAPTKEEKAAGFGQ